MVSFANRSHKDSFASALNGLVLSFKTQPNFKIMFPAFLLVMILGFVLEVSQSEMILLVFASFFVFICEMINTSIESIVDLVTEEWKQNAKVAKDVSGGMVLLSVILSIIVGVIIFLPKVT